MNCTPKKIKGIRLDKKYPFGCGLVHFMLERGIIFHYRMIWVQEVIMLVIRREKNIISLRGSLYSARLISLYFQWSLTFLWFVSQLLGKKQVVVLSLELSQIPRKSISSPFFFYSVTINHQIAYIFKFKKKSVTLSKEIRFVF